jgi:uncharacterized membrane protein
MQYAGARMALWLGVLFFVIMLAVGLNRYFTLFSSYDHGLFTQLFWNNLHGDWFQSSLTSSNSVESLEDGVIPRTSFFHLGQHLVLSFAVLTPLVAIAANPITLIVLQTLLMTAGVCPCNYPFGSRPAITLPTPSSALRWQISMSIARFRSMPLDCF